MNLHSTTLRLALALATAAAFSVSAAAEAGDVSVVRTSTGADLHQGTYRVEILSRLGRPDAVLVDGGWVYANRIQIGSGARGNLIVSFADEAVCRLVLAPTREPAKPVSCQMAAATPAPKLASKPATKSRHPRPEIASR